MRFIGARRSPGLALSATLVAIGCGGSDGGGGDVVDAAVSSIDAPLGGGVDAGLPDGNTPDPGDCGSLKPDIAGITGTEGIAIGIDGTIYFSQSGGVGRLQPGQAVEPKWAKFADSGTVWGVALTDKHLYAGFRTGTSVWRVDLTTGKGEKWLDGAGEPNGVIIGADGALYYSDFAGDQVYRVDLETKKRTSVVTGATIGSPNGLYSLDATHLLVLSYQDADVWELTLRDGAEVSRTRRSDLTGNLDGITRDAQGRWYLTDNGGRRVLQRQADFSAPAGGGVLATGISGAANLVFGRGALSCTDLYVASSSGIVRIEVK